MSNLNYVLLSVREPLVSSEIYDQVLGVKPVERAKTFVLYVLPSGLKVGLWATADVQPKPRPAGGMELSFQLPDKAAVRATFESWKKLGLEAVQEPCEMDFGFTCVLQDADGHRLRPFVLGMDPK